MNVEFVTSSPDLGGRPEQIFPEFAFIGRSNCGKSSLINHFLERKSIARISGKPGKTRLLNYFLVENRFYIVDLPGYGYAKVSKKLRAVWYKLFKQFLQSQDRPLAIFQLLDVRHNPTKEDKEISSWLVESGHPFAIAVTKIDKIGTNSRKKRYSEIAEVMDLPEDTPFIETSAEKNTGREQMLAWVDALVTAYESENI